MVWIADHHVLLGAFLVFCFFGGFLLGRSVGLAKGRDAVIRKVKMLIVRGKVDFNIEDILRAEFRGRKKIT